MRGLRGRGNGPGLVALIVLLLVPVERTRAEEKPNVLLIAIDDLNDWIGCLGGHPQAHTPNIDRLAARGMLFTNAHCASPACNPSRAAIFSGLLPDKTGVWSNDSGRIGKLKPDAVMLTKPFQDAGYLTLGTGKLLHGGGGTLFEDYFATEQRWSPLPNRKAVEYTKAELPSKGSEDPRKVVRYKGKEWTLPLNRMPSDRAPRKPTGESFDWGPFDVPDEEFGDTRITNWAIEKLGKGGEKPFFLAVGYYRPHIPLWAPKRFFERFGEAPASLPPVREDDLADLGPLARKWAREAVTAGSHATVVRHGQWRQAVEAYLACVTYVDYEIGRLLEALERSGQAKRTMIVLWSDHGWHLGEKEHWGKWTGWERSTRVPLILVPPAGEEGFSSAGSRCRQPVGLIDLFPTLMDLCGLEAPPGLDGRSLRPLLEEPEKATGRVLVTTFDQGNLSARTDRWRYLRYKDGSEELYDLQADPHEWSNLVGRPGYEKELARLRAAATIR